MIDTKKNQQLKLGLILIFILPIFLLLAIILFRQNLSKTNELKELPIVELNQENLNNILARSKGANYVLLGEASHGTAEYYDWRRKITKKLIEEQNFNFIAVEGDWASLYQVNQYVKGLSEETVNARDILTTFHRWPTWMWANEEFLHLVEWLREYNQNLPLGKRVGVYGKDVYGVTDAMTQVVNFLNQRSPNLAPQAEEAYECMEKYNGDFSAYISDYINQNQSCEKQVVGVVDLLRNNSDILKENDLDGEFFNAKQNALVVKHGELHYRSSAIQGPESWNNRVRYMKQAVNRLSELYGDQSKGIIWAHNTHVGDARATEMADSRMINIGQLLREKYGEDKVYIIGFGTNQGTVAAGRQWGLPMEIMNVPEARSDSIEYYLNTLDLDAFILFLKDENLPQKLIEPHGHRAKGVVYNPEREAGNYVMTLLPERYDAFIFIDQTEALTPL